MGNAIALFGLYGLLIASPTEAYGLPACLARIGEKPSVAGVSVVDVPSIDDGYKALRVSADRGAYFFIYYDNGSEAAARSRAACLGAQLPMLQAELGDGRDGIEWASVVFTQDSRYIPPRGKGIKTRWTVNTDAAGQLPSLSERMIVSVIPHEQVHDYQNRADVQIPRWFAEGHAAWVGFKITTALSPAIARADEVRREADLVASTMPLNLEGWGSVQPRREAYLRQVSAEDRARMEADPTYRPSGTFKFTRDDFIGDESNMQARYAGARNVFRQLEKRFGNSRTKRWIAEITSSRKPMSNAAMASSVQTHFGVKIDELLSAQDTHVVRAGTVHNQVWETDRF